MGTTVPALILSICFPSHLINLAIGLTVKALFRRADSAGRALSSIVCKMIKAGGFTYNIYTKLVLACVTSIAEYGSEVIGYCDYESPNKLYLRAARAFLGIPKNGPIPGIIAEISWLLPHYSRRLKMIRFYDRMLNLEDDRLTKVVYLWDKHLNTSHIVNTWHYEIYSIFNQCNLPGLYEMISKQPLELIINNLKINMLRQQQEEISLKCQEKPKLRTYIKIANFKEIPAYLTTPIPYVLRRLICKARLGCLPLRLETARYSRPVIPAEERICNICDNVEGNIEDIFHLLFVCDVYTNERNFWMQKLLLPDVFQLFVNEDKLITVLSGPYNVRSTARFIMKAMDKRSCVIREKTSNNIYHTDPPEECIACNP